MLNALQHCCITVGYCVLDVYSERTGTVNITRFDILNKKQLCVGCTAETVNKCSQEQLQSAFYLV